MAIKLDMKKSYGRIDEKFIQNCFIVLGFSEINELDYDMHYNHYFLLC